MKKKLSRTALAAALVPAIVLMIVAWEIFPLQCLTLRLPKKDNRLAFLTPAAPGDDFSVSYRHSVEKTRVKGLFRVSDRGQILAVETWMTSVGTGLPNTFPDRTRKAGDWMVVDEQLTPVEDFRFFVVPVNQAVLSIKNRRVRLDTFSPGTILLINIEPVSLPRYLTARAGDFFSPSF